MPTEEPTADAWVSPVNNSPLGPSGVPSGSQSPFPTDLPSQIRHQLAMAADAVQRACDAVPDGNSRWSQVDYFFEQLSKARGYVSDAEERGYRLADQTVDLDDQAGADGEPSTADLVPFPKIEDAGKGGAA